MHTDRRLTLAGLLALTACADAPCTDDPDAVAEAGAAVDTGEVAAAAPDSGEAAGDSGEAAGDSGASAGDSGAPAGDSGTLTGGGAVTFSLWPGGLYRISVEDGAIESLTDALDDIAPGEDDYVNLSYDGEWLLLESERGHGDCAGWSCLAVAPADLSSLEVMVSGGAVIHPDGGAAIAAGGERVVFVGADGPNAQDLYLVERGGAAWGRPSLLTGASPHAYNAQPRFAPDGASLLFDCGPTVYGQEGTAICEVTLEGAVSTLLAPTDHDGGTADNALRSAAIAPDGSVVFEADWSGEQLWRLDPVTGSHALINSSHGNDNSPCVLPDGRIVSLWLERPGGAGVHELKLMEPGGAHTMLLVDEDVIDNIIGCGS